MVGKGIFGADLGKDHGRAMRDGWVPRYRGIVLRVWAERFLRQLRREVLRVLHCVQDDGNYNCNCNGNGNYNCNCNGKGEGNGNYNGKNRSSACLSQRATALEDQCTSDGGGDFHFLLFEAGLVGLHYGEG